ncbi:MAG: pitrilysin family protein [Acholeplasmataceae bacterium]|nr:insulinase family protein [Acholeplasmataceae bacterium]
MITVHSQFKTIQIAFYFTAVDEKATRVYRFLLPKVLGSHTRSLPTRTRFIEKLETLYGAQLSLRTELHANLSVMSFVFSFVQPTFVHDETLLRDVVSLINDIFIKREHFNQDIFNEEKRFLMEEWETVKEQKDSYASLRFSELFHKNSLAGYPLAGQLKDIKKLTNDQLWDYFQTTFSKENVQIIVNGDLAENQLEQLKELKIKANDTPLTLTYHLNHNQTEEVIDEFLPMNQAIIKMGYQLPIVRTDPLYEAALIVDTIVGGYPESRLFKIIREEEGLSYYISSTYNYYRGTLIISSGVQLEKRQEAVTKIKALVKALKTKGITEIELEYAKSFLLHQMKSSFDSQSILTKRAFLHYLFPDLPAFDHRLERIRKVTLEEVNQALKQLKLKTVYVLHGDES